MSSKTQGPDQGTDAGAPRHLQSSSLLEFITPPTGYLVDHALCSAYSGQCAVLVAMLAAMVRQGAVDGVNVSSLALARALQRLEGRVHFLLQHGRLSAPRKAVRILHMLDRYIVPVRCDEREASWHPKVCVIRFAPVESKKGKDAAMWRLWIGSRNFTRDESWDMALALGGEAGGEGEELPDAPEIARKLAIAANVEAAWTSAIDELRTVRWQVPAGLRIEKLSLFMPGEVPRTLVPAPRKSRSILAVSPFLDGWAVERLLQEFPSPAPSTTATRPRIVSTEPCFANTARTHRESLARYELLSLPVSEQDEKEDIEQEPEDAADDGLQARGLHAKFIWIETPGRGELRLGSTNLTRRGWKDNAEALAVVSMAVPGGNFTGSLRSGLSAFTALCTELILDEAGKEPDSSEKLRDEFDELRKEVVHSLRTTQVWRENRAVVKAQSPPEIGLGASLRIGRIGDVLYPWPTGGTELALPESPMFENGDFVQVELVLGELRSAWMHHAPFVPSLSRAERDLPLLHSYLGIHGVLALLNDSLTTGGNAGGERRRWDEEHRQSFSSASVALLGIESVLGSWMRDAESLREISRIVEIAKQCKPLSEAEASAYRQLQDFLQSWEAVEKELAAR